MCATATGRHRANDNATHCPPGFPGTRSDMYDEGEDNDVSEFTGRGTASYAHALCVSKCKLTVVSG
jgi:hypothetical protein